MARSVEERYEDWSIIAEVARNYEDLLAPPQIEVPQRDYSQRSEKSHLPDGTQYDQNLQAPIGEPLDKAIYRISKEANEAWKHWVNTKAQEALLLRSGELVAPLKAPLEEIFFTNEEKKDYIRIKRLQKKEEILYYRQETSYIRRLISETNPEPACRCTEVQIPDTSRYYKDTEKVQDHLGNTLIKAVVKDRCKGNPIIKRDNEVKVPNIERARFSPSHQERLYLTNLTSHETETWRTPIRVEDTLYFPNIGPEDDPDFINPISTSKRNFNIYPPAARPYNIVFKMYYDPDPNYDAPPGAPWDNSKAFRKFKKIYPAVKKDYTSFSSMQYLIKQKYKGDFALEFDMIKVKDGAIPNCKFEPDIRVTYAQDCLPNPTNYKKVDPETILGKKLLQMLNEQPYLFKESSWTTEEADEVTGVVKEVKKVVVSIDYPKGPGGPRVYWFYLDKRKALGGRFRFRWVQGYRGEKSRFVLNKKLTPPQVIFIPFSNYREGAQIPNYLKRDIPYLAVLRMSEGFFYKDKKGDFVNFEQVEASYLSYLSSLGYILYHKGPENGYTNVLSYKFVHTSMKTKELRREAALLLRDVR